MARLKEKYFNEIRQEMMEKFGYKTIMVVPKVSKMKASKTPKLVQTIREYFGSSCRHADEALDVLEDNDILDYAAQLGYQKEDIKVIKKELKARGKV